MIHVWTRQSQHKYQITPSLNRRAKVNTKTKSLTSSLDVLSSCKTINHLPSSNYDNFNAATKTPPRIFLGNKLESPYFLCSHHPHTTNYRLAILLRASWPVHLNFVRHLGRALYTTRRSSQIEMSHLFSLVVLPSAKIPGLKSMLQSVSPTL